MGGNIHKEIEVKLRLTNLAALKRSLAKLRARPASGGRVHEMNTLFDTPQGGLAKHGQLLRLRVEEAARRGGKGRKTGAHGKVAATNKTGQGARGNRVILTYKGPSEAATAAGRALGRRYKVREELEVAVANPESLAQILEALGLRGWFRYEKHRTSFELPRMLGWANGLHVVVDETPIGDFLELEGPPEAIDRAAQLLGYAPADYITKSYLALYLEQCRRQGVQPSHMLFSARGK